MQKTAYISNPVSIIIMQPASFVRIVSCMKTIKRITLQKNPFTWALRPICILHLISQVVEEPIYNYLNELKKDTLEEKQDLVTLY